MTTRRRFLLTGHDAGGTVPPMLALAQALVRDNDVVYLGQPCVRRRAEEAGCTFVEFSSIPDYDPRRPLEEQPAVLDAMTSAGPGDDLRACVERENIDGIVVDANLAGVLAAAETLPQPSAVLFHSMYKTFVDTWFADIWPFVAPAINATRRGYGLADASDWPAVFADHDILLSVVPEMFDATPSRAPRDLRHFGFLVPKTGSQTRRAPFPSGDDPAVLVGMSTTFQGQADVLVETIEALGASPVRALVTTAGQLDMAARRCPANVTILEYVPHALALPEADMMVTHAGMGSVAGALSFGVPLVCTPIARDQPLNAQRLAELGAGIDVGARQDSGTIAAAIAAVLSTSSYRDAARSVAVASAQEGGAEAAAAALAALLD